MPAIKIKPQGLLSRMGDYLMLPLMYVLQGNFRESPQRTHYWNNISLNATDLRALEDEQLVNVTEAVDASPRWKVFLPIFHIPIFGGWKHYVVIEPTVPQDCWFVGWIAGDLAGLSRIPLVGPVRVLRGATPVQFFGLNEHGNQIAIQEVGRGIVGNAPKEHCRIPLL